jgi:hypothetical protein
MQLLNGRIKADDSGCAAEEASSSQSKGQV